MKSKIFASLICLLFAVVFGVGGWSAGIRPMYAVLKAWHATSGWQPVGARVIQAELKSNSDETTTYRVTAQYAYEFAGRSFEGKRVGLLDGGYDNIGTWQRAWYEKLHQAQEGGGTVTAWVNPAQPEQALLDRDMRWNWLLFQIPFAVLFPAIALGALWGLQKILRAPSMSVKAEAIRTNEPAIRSNERGLTFALWAFALFWNIFSFPFAGLFLSESSRHGPLIWLVALFPLIGIFLAWMAVKVTVAWRRFGEITLRLLSPELVAGEKIKATIAFEKAEDRPRQYSVTLMCEKVDDRGDTSTARVIWESQKVLSRIGDSANFEFRPPSGLPASETPAKIYVRWRIVVQTDDKELDRSFDIAVQSPGVTGADFDHGVQPEFRAVLPAPKGKHPGNRRQLVFASIAFFLFPAIVLYAGWSAMSPDRARSDDGLMSALDREDFQALQYQFDHGADPNTYAENGSSLLMMASARGNLPLVKFLLDHGAKVNDKYKDVIKGMGGGTALTAALHEGSPEVAMALLDAGARADVSDTYGWSAIHHAARRDCVACVQLLIDRRLAGVDDPAPGNRGETALMVAAEFGNLELIRWLVEHGASLHAKDRYGENVVGWAAFYKQPAATSLLKTFER